ncbi:dihydrofolate reductase [Acuticoccus sp. M5D2P5]|uniref:dihydrofolate reductase n=1 Tax=Acuticoccus kalidii TaxID=2910977 RepID=UPI001F201E58|nr:dihydrofolate reductase [Acuticoccus kalidii]MCF3935466.1 dihydrofolate reductase [Acuticoccus kalidii]
MVGEGQPVTLIAAVAENGVIGRGLAIPWRVSSDLRRFKARTTGNTIIIGRRTHESIGKTLPGRRTIVVTRRPIDGVEAAKSLAEAIAMSTTPVFLAGGARIYAEGMALADGIEITRVHATPDGDVHFPPIDPERFRLVDIVPGEQGERDEFAFSFETYARTPTGN